MIPFKWSSKTDESKQMLVKDTYIGDKTVKKGKGIINTKFRGREGYFASGERHSIKASKVLVMFY